MNYLIGILIVPALLSLWLLVQYLARRYARAHPEFGAFREEGGGCGKSCSCSAGGSCRNDTDRGGH
jgi:hypothetical protein